MRTTVGKSAWLLAALLSCGEPPLRAPDAGNGASDAATAGLDASGNGEAGADAQEAGEDAARPSLPDGSLPDAGRPDAAERADAALEEDDAAVPAGPDAAAPGPDAGPECDPPCGAGQVCLGTTCSAVAFDAPCALGRAALVLSGNHSDDAVAAEVASALAAHCGAGFVVTTRSLADPAVFQAGRLTTPRGELVITAGGYYFNPLVGALETGRVSPLFFITSPTQLGWKASATGQPVYTFPKSAVGPTHDYLVVELFPDGDGRLVLLLYGVGLGGTYAAGVEATALLSCAPTDGSTWRVSEWSLDADAGTEATHTVASGCR